MASPLPNRASTELAEAESGSGPAEVASRQAPPPLPPASLFFLSTQIQSRHDDHHQQERQISRLQQFKNPAPVVRGGDLKVVKRAARKKKTKVNSISGFVRDTLGAKGADPQSILDYFCGDKDKVSAFLARMDSATASKHVLSSASTQLGLFSEPEWKPLLESIRLKFPNLSRKSRKSLKVITRRLEEVKRVEDRSQALQDLEVMWTQALMQPSDKLTTEDLKWLYDLDDEQLTNDVSVDLLDGEQRSQMPFLFTLSQAMESSQQPSLPSDEPIPDSQSDLEALEDDPDSLNRVSLASPATPEREQVIESQKPETLTLRPVPSLTRIPSHQKFDAASADVLTSISFAPTCDKTEHPLSSSPVKAGPKESVFSSPVNATGDEVFKTPSKWSANLQITSSPPSRSKSIQSQLRDVEDSQQEIYLTAKSGHGKPSNIAPVLQTQPSDLVSIDLSPLRLKRINYDVQELEYHGDIDLKQNTTSRVRLKKVKTVPVTLDDAVPDSEEDEGELTIIEISKPVQETSFTSAEVSVLQVPSSPNV